MVPEMWDKPLWDRVWSHLDPWVCVPPRTAPTHWNVPGKYEPHGELFFFFKKEEQVVGSNEVLPNPSVSAERLKACVLIGLLLLAAEYEVGSSGRQSPDLGDMWRKGCPKSTATLCHGQEAKALLLLSSANTTWKVLLLMFWCKTSQVRRSLSSLIGNLRGWP